MMQKTIALTLTLALALTACACSGGNREQTADISAPVTATPETETVEIPVPEPTATQAAPAPAVPAAADGTVLEKLNVMLPVLDSLVRSIGIAGDTVYAPDDPAFCWNVLYLMGENYGGTYPTVTTEGDAVRVPTGAMQAFYAAAFAGKTQLPEQPADSREIAAYDAAADAYLLAPSDMGAAEVALERYCALSDGSVYAVIGLYNVEELLGTLRFTLVPHPDAASFYPYAVTAAARETDLGSGFTALSVTEENALDLDGDGAADTLAFAATENEGMDVRMTLSGGTVLSDTVEYLYNPTAYTDGSLVYLCGDTGSDDYITRIYRVRDGQLSQTEVEGTVQGVPGTGELLMEQTVDVLGTYGALCRYRFADDGLRLDRAGDYAVWQSEGYDRRITTAKDGLAVTDEASGAALTLPAGTALLLLGTDEAAYASLETADGTRVRLTLEQNADEWGYLISGTAEADWFDMLLYAG